MLSSDLQELLDQKFEQFNQPNFIENDPIQIPHRFSQKQDIEIAGLFSAVLAWGLRKTIIAKCSDLLQRMDNAPYDFIRNHTPNDLKNFTDFKHRTFNPTDTLYFIHFLRQHYEKSDSLETAFLLANSSKNQSQNLPETVEIYLIQFYNYFVSLPDFPDRTKKHISSPAKKSACKRMNMFLRWMVRNDNKGVDFGIWKNLKTSQLVCPLDVHVDKVARKLGLISRKPTDWRTALELTENLRKFDAQDPIKYDFALFGMGLEMAGKA